MPTQKTILITGITGQQGGAVAAELAGAGFQLKGMTRKPDSPAAEALKRKGVTIVQGDLNDEASLRKALAGAWGVFAVQNTCELSWSSHSTAESSIEGLEARDDSRQGFGGVAS